jgi:hypothetical protein
VVPAFVPLQEFFQVERHVAHLEIAAIAHSWVTSAETSCDQPSFVLKPTTRTGLPY